MNKILLVALLLAVINQFRSTVLFYCGVNTLDPMALEEEAIVRIPHLKSHAYFVNRTIIRPPRNAQQPSSPIRLAAFDEASLYEIGRAHV